MVKVGDNGVEGLVRIILIKCLRQRIRRIRDGVQLSVRLVTASSEVMEVRMDMSEMKFEMYKTLSSQKSLRVK